jgi:predicted nucleic acid-binding protein
VIVVDASVVANALIDPGSAGVIARSVLREESDIAAPDLIDVETVSALRGHWLASRITDRLFRTATDDLVLLPIVRHPARPFLARSYELRANVTSYDALYVALAEALGCALVTGDARLAAAPGPTCETRLLQT